VAKIYTIQEIQDASPEQLEVMRRDLARGFVLKFGGLFLFKVGVGLALRHWSKKLNA